MLCSMVAMLRGRKSIKRGSCGQPGAGDDGKKGPVRKERMMEGREEVRNKETKKESCGNICAGDFTFFESLLFDFLSP